jgi:DNA-binding transcriptional MerR regulator
MSEDENNVENTLVRYSFEKVASITGVSRTTIIEYCETGLLPVEVAQVETTEFDDAMINLIRRVEALRTVHGLNHTGIRMILKLTDEVEKLRQELKFRLDG